MEGESCHIPVMTQEVLDALRAADGGDFLDCTLGGAGHSVAILDANPRNTVLAIDRDLEAVQRVEKVSDQYNGRFNVHHASFADVRECAGERRFDGMLADLGLSSDQLAGGRGFSFKDADALDMRMDTTAGVTAAQLVNEAEERELFRILKKGGVGREASRVVRAIVDGRPFNDAQSLAAAINHSLRGLPGTKQKVNPATVAFQAIRIAVNREFEQIHALLEALPELGRSGARVVIITFHSLEDKAVTKVLRSWAQGDSAPAWWPQPEKKPSLGKMISNKPILPSEQELQANPRARSARLRVFEFH